VTVSAPGLAPVTVEAQLGSAAQKGSALTLGVRPESVAITDAASQRATISGHVRLVEHLGRETILYVDAGPLQCVSSESGTGNITVQIGHVAGVAADTSISLRVDPREIYLFSESDERTVTVRKPILDK